MVLKMEINKQQQAFIKEIPKVELHLHLDGSLSQEFIAEQSERQGISLPVPADQIQMYLLDQKCNGNPFGKSGTNWNIFDFCNQFLQTSESLTAAVEDLLTRLREWNVVYSEIRFCPALHTLKGLAQDQVMDAVLKGFRNQSDIEGGMIVCALRSMGEDHCIEMAELAGKYKMESASDPIGVVGFDVAGDEGRFPLNSKDCPMFKGVMKAKSLGIRLTLHAGEWPDWDFNTIENVTFALETIGVDRIGHGIAMGRHTHVRELAKKLEITTEVCLTSNVGRRFKVKSFETHPAKIFFEEGLPFSLSCDNTLLSGDMELQADPIKEVHHLVFDVMDSIPDGWKALKYSLISGIKAGFSPRIDELYLQNFIQRLSNVFKRYEIPE